MNKEIINILRYILKALWHCHAQNSIEFTENFLKAHDLINDLEANTDSTVVGE